MLCGNPFHLYQTDNTRTEHTAFISLLFSESKTLSDKGVILQKPFECVSLSVALKKHS